MPVFPTRWLAVTLAASISLPLVADDPDAFVERYNAGEAVLTTDDPTVVFVVRHPEAPCQAMPETRPEDFEITLRHRVIPRGKSPQSMHWGVTGDVCHFTRALHLDAPRVDCTVLDDDALEVIYNALRDLALETVTATRSRRASPHRGGYGISLRWRGGRCDISDVGRSSVDEASRPAFEAAVELVSDVVRSSTEP